MMPDMGGHGTACKAFSHSLFKATFFHACTQQGAIRHLLNATLDTEETDMSKIDKNFSIVELSPW
jgi:hypothetical protein